MLAAIRQSRQGTFPIRTFLVLVFGQELTILQRAKLPKWIGQTIKDPDTNLSTDMAISSSKKFLRTMAQPFEQSTKSLWGLEEVLQKQRKDAGIEDEDDEMEIMAQIEQDGTRGGARDPMEDAFDEIDDAHLMALDL